MGAAGETERPLRPPDERETPSGAHLEHVADHAGPVPAVQGQMPAGAEVHTHVPPEPRAQGPLIAQHLPRPVQVGRQLHSAFDRRHGPSFLACATARLHDVLSVSSVRNRVVAWEGGPVRRFRFGVHVASPTTRREWVEAARKAEGLGYDVLLTADHVTANTSPPLLPLVTVAEATERLRVGTFVLNNDLHHPVLLARQAAMLDVLSDGRFELGLGAGHMRSEYEAIGVAFDPGAVRVERLEESVAIIVASWRGGHASFHGRHHRVDGDVLHPRPVQQPHPPLLIGGNGRRILSLAAREAGIVGLAGLSAADGAIRPDGFTRDGARQRIAWVREAAPDRFDELELNALVQHVEITIDPTAAGRQLVDRWSHFGLDPADLLATPYLLIGDQASLVDHLTGIRQELGISYFTVFEHAMDDLAPVVAQLAGR